MKSWTVRRIFPFLLVQVQTSRPKQERCSFPLFRSAFCIQFGFVDETLVLYSRLPQKGDERFPLPAHPEPSHTMEDPAVQHNIYNHMASAVEETQTYCSACPPRRLFASYLQYVYTLGRYFVILDKEKWEKWNKNQKIEKKTWLSKGPGLNLPQNNGAQRTRAKTGKFRSIRDIIHSIIFHSVRIPIKPDKTRYFSNITTPDYLDKV